ncbi:GIY-YIG nuclease family protein [Pontibacter ruber]|uniref:GIY-YIG nuclease family protein n=2 Tax=Pontibacter ruber TaxID=1343895 RepID=A0ABW5D0R2_9BACT|nr:GIY-YIG nuclease family protein [Pontibacter ruber]
MPHYIYILYSEKVDRYYVGSCQDITDRLGRHNAGYSKSTKAGAPWQLKHIEEYDTNSKAITRETEIKRKKSRKYIEWLISSAG